MTFNITLTEEQVMLILAGLSDRRQVLIKCAIDDQRPESNAHYHKAAKECDDLNQEIRRQTGRM